MKAEYFDGNRSARHQVDLCVEGGRVRLRGEGIERDEPLDLVRVPVPIVGVPCRLALPGGAECVLQGDDPPPELAVRLRGQRLEALAHRLEGSTASVAASAVAVIAAAALAVGFVIPAAARFVALHLDPASERQLGEQTLASLDQHYLVPSKLDQATRERIGARFATLLAAEKPELPAHLEFRAAPILGPNAFALPGGTVVLLDELVELAEYDDDEVAAVLAHEIGHVRGRHSLQEMIRDSGTEMVVGLITGQSFAVSSSVETLIAARSSRELESEADDHALELMDRTGIPREAFATVFVRFEARRTGGASRPDFLSTHPADAERIARIRAGVTPPAGASSAAQP